MNTVETLIALEILITVKIPIKQLKPIIKNKVQTKCFNCFPKKGKRQVGYIHRLTNFFLSATLSNISSTILESAGLASSFLILLIIIIIGIIFDIIGIAITTAEEAPFHSMASRKLYGAKQAIKLIRSANKASTICNDVIGDICGVISGAASSYIIITISKTASLTTAAVAGFSLTGLVASGYNRR